MGTCRMCESCKYHERWYTPGPWNDPWFCMNYYSDLYGSATDHECTCDRWEERENKANN